MSFINLLFLSDYSNAFTAARTDGFHYIHVFKVAHFAIDVPSLVVLRHDIGRGCDVEGFAVQASHALDVSPHVVFAADAPGSGEVVNVLIRVKVFKAALFK